MSRGAAGVSDPNGKSLGVAVLDYNGDGWPDLFVANDTQPNKLYRNLQNGKFKEEGLAAGVAFGEDGVARGAMGVDSGDYDRSGKQHLIVGNFSNQMLGLYHNEGNGLFVDEAPRSPLGRATLLNLTFGLFFFDYDLDGYPDIFTANGHIEEEIARVQPKVKYSQTPQLFHNLGQGKFEPVPAFTRSMVARGAAYGDFDRDGDLDILIANNNGPAVLYRNDGGNRNHWLQLRLTGTKSNRDGIGAVVRDRPAIAGRAQRQLVLLVERSRAHLRARRGGGACHDRNRLAQRHAPETRERQARSAPYDHRTMNEILTLSAVAQSKLIRDGEISSEELVRLHLDRIAEINPALNAVLKLPDAGPCSFVFSVKDSIEIKGHRCTAGTLGYRDRPPATEDAALVARLRAAGGAPIARTNLPDLLFAFETRQPDLRQDQQSIRLNAHSRRIERRRSGADRRLRLTVRTGQRRRRAAFAFPPISAASRRSNRPAAGFHATVMSRRPADGSSRSGRSVRWRAMSKI